MKLPSCCRRLLCAGLLLLLSACSWPSPTPTATPTATPTPTPTATPTPTPSPSPLPTPTPSPVPPGSDGVGLFFQAEALVADGDYDHALQLYREVQQRYAGTAAADQALLYVAQTYLAMGHALSATAVLSPALGSLAQPMQHQAQFLQAEALRQSGNYVLAIPLYQAYLVGGTTLEDLIAERQAWCYRALGIHALAATEFTRAASTNRSLSDQVWLLEEAARELRAQGDYNQALDRYESILSLARKTWYRASIMYQVGETLQEAGRIEEAQSRWQEILDSYPETNAASWAADDLLSAGVPVDAYQIARAYWAAGRPIEALPWFEEALGQGSAPVQEVRYDLALARAAAGDLDGALAELDTLYQDSPSDPHPLLEQGRLLGEAGAIARALEVYQSIVQQFPSSAEAGESLWRSAQLLEQQHHDEEAVRTYLDLLEQHPDHGRASQARFRAGLLRYQQGRFAEAASIWAQGDESGSPRSSLWQGLALDRAGRSEDAHQAWETAAEGEGYYAVRARDLLSGPQDLGRFQGWPAWGDETEDRARAQDWLSQYWGQAVSDTLPLAVQEDLHFRRGEELLALGRPDEAQQSFSLLIERFRHDGPALYALALYLRQHHLHSHSILCGDRIERLLPDGEHEATPFLLRLRYPPAYAHLIIREAQANDIDPLLFFALVRRESYFDRYATSWADARGLTQVIPSTGEWIAGQLGVVPFRLEDLYRPIISVRFGTWYLGDQLRTFEGQVVPALSAYNGGPGNALRWAGQVTPVPDLDLFVEAVDFTETRSYIEYIYIDYGVYRRLYVP